MNISSVMPSGRCKCSLLNFCALQDKTSQAGAVVADKATDAGEVVVAKSKEVGSFTKEIAGDVKGAVFHDAEAERKRIEEEENAKKGKGLFGLFGRKK